MYIKLRRINSRRRGLRRQSDEDWWTQKEMSSFHRPTTYSSTAGDRKKPLFLISCPRSWHPSRWILKKIRSACRRCCAQNYKLQTKHTSDEGSIYGIALGYLFYECWHIENANTSIFYHFNRPNFHFKVTLRTPMSRLCQTTTLTRILATNKLKSINFVGYNF